MEDKNSMVVETTTEAPVTESTPVEEGTVDTSIDSSERI